MIYGPHENQHKEHLVRYYAVALLPHPLLNMSPFIRSSTGAPPLNIRFIRPSGVCILYNTKIIKS